MVRSENKRGASVVSERLLNLLYYFFDSPINLSNIYDEK
jgi:hypothetical protein